MTLYQLEKLIYSCFEPKKGITIDERNELLMKINYCKKKANERELLDERIAHLKEQNNTKKQIVNQVQKEFSLSANRIYEVIKEGGYYE